MLWKITMLLMGKSTISMAIFNSFLLVHQRVYFIDLQKGACPSPGPPHVTQTRSSWQPAFQKLRPHPGSTRRMRGCLNEHMEAMEPLYTLDIPSGEMTFTAIAMERSTMPLIGKASINMTNTQQLPWKDPPCY